MKPNKKSFRGSLFVVSICFLLFTTLCAVQAPVTQAALKGDINGDGVLDLTDAILALQVVSGMNPDGVRVDFIKSSADADTDLKIGLAEPIYVMQRLGGRNAAPTANAGPDRIVSVDSKVVLNGRRSHDLDGDPLTYTWSLVSTPPNSTAALSDVSAINPTFTADIEGDYVVSCVANDGQVEGTPHITTITAKKDEYLTITPAGGKYTFGNGIEIDVPSGAVPANIDILIRFLDFETAADIVEYTGLTQKELIVAFRAEPTGLVFTAPVTVTLPVSRSKIEVLPLHFHLDLQKESCAPALTNLRWYPNEKQISISLSGFSDYGIAATHTEEGEKYCKEIGECKCGRTYVQEEARDNVYDSGGCQIVELVTTNHFLDCPEQPEQTDVIREISEGCKPEMTIQGPGSVLCGEEQEIAALVTLKDLRLEGEEVEFSVSSPHTIKPETMKTWTNGVAPVNFSAADQYGIATVDASAEVTYELEYQVAGGETFTARERTVNLETSHDIIVLGDLTVDAQQTELHVGDEVPVNATLQCGSQPLGTHPITFEVSPGSKGEVVPNAINTSANGQAQTSFKANEEGTATITASWMADLGSGQTQAVTDSVGLLIEPIWHGTLSLDASVDRTTSEKWEWDIAVDIDVQFTTTESDISGSGSDHAEFIPGTTPGGDCHWVSWTSVDFDVTVSGKFNETQFDIEIMPDLSLVNNSHVAWACGETQLSSEYGWLPAEILVNDSYLGTIESPRQEGASVDGSGTVYQDEWESHTYNYTFTLSK